MNIPSACRILNIALNDAMILPYDANLGRMEFSERTTTKAMLQGKRAVAGKCNLRSRVSVLRDVTFNSRLQPRELPWIEAKGIKRSARQREFHGDDLTDFSN